MNMRIVQNVWHSVTNSWGCGGATLVALAIVLRLGGVEMFDANFDVREFFDVVLSKDLR